MFNEQNTSKNVQIDGINIHYHDTEENKPALILLHGGGPGASAWSNFRLNLPYLSENFRVIAPDMPHYGGSDKPLDRFFDTEWYSLILSRLMDAIGVNKAHLVGNSMGGAIALLLALNEPNKVDRLVLMGTAGSIPMFSAMPTEGVKQLNAYYQAEEGPSRENLEAAIRAMVFDHSKITPDFLESRYQASIAPELLVKRKLNMDNIFTLWRKVDQVHHKTLLVYGRDDRVVPWDTGLLLMRLMPNADLHIFTRSGHWTQWERAPEFNSIVDSFLRTSEA